MNPFTRVVGGCAGCRVAAVFTAGAVILGAGAAVAGAKTPAQLPPGAKHIASVGSSSTSGSPGAPREFVEGELIVRFKPGADRGQARRAGGARLKQELPGVPGLEVLELDHGKGVRAAARSFEARGDVLYAEPNFIYRAQATSNDSRLGQYWGHNNTGQTINGITGTADADMDILEAWNITKASPNVVVAVIDTGVAYDHPDLALNMWANPGETCTSALPNRCRDGVDNDGNGFKDDVRGADMVGANDGDPRDEQGHGTHVAGTIAARGNNDTAGAHATDGVGVSHQAKIQAIRVLDANGSGATDDIVEGYHYAGRNGAKVANASLGGLGYSQAASDAIKAANNVLFVIAAGNGSSDGVGDDNDTTPTYPCSYTAPTNIVCVAATNSKDQFTGFSNYGATSVDVAAPGENILSTYPAFRTVWTETLATDPFSGGRWTRGGTPNTWGRSLELTNNAGQVVPSLADSPNDTYAPNADNWARRTAASNLTGLMNCGLNYFTLLETEAYQDPDTGEWDVYDYMVVEAATSTAGPWTVIGAYFGAGSGSPTDALGTFSGKSSVYLRYRFLSDEGYEYDGVYVVGPSLKCLGTTYSASDFHFENGTSMASPYTAGVAALMFARFPTMTVAQARTKLLRSVDVKSALNQPGKKVATGGRVNAYKALAETTASVASGVLNVTAGTGTTNKIAVSRIVESGIAKYLVTDPYGASGSSGSRVVPGAGCVAASTTTVKCNASGISRVKVLAGDLNDTVTTSTVTVPVTLDGGLGNDTLTSGAGADTLTGGTGGDKFLSGAGNDIINAKDDVADLSFACGESTGDSDRVNADATPDDPVTQSATNCEVVGKT